MKRLLFATLVLAACATEQPTNGVPPVADAARECVQIAPFVERFAAIPGIQHAVFTEGALARVLFMLNHLRPDTSPEVQADRLDLWRAGNQERAIFSLKGCVTYSEIDASGNFMLSRFVNRALGGRDA